MIPKYEHIRIDGKDGAPTIEGMGVHLTGSDGLAVVHAMQHAAKSPEAMARFPEACGAFLNHEFMFDLLAGDPVAVSALVDMQKDWQAKYHKSAKSPPPTETKPGA